MHHDFYNLCIYEFNQCSAKSIITALALVGIKIPPLTCRSQCSIFSLESTRSISSGSYFSCSDNPGRRQDLAHILNIRYMHGKYRFYLVIAAFSFLNSAKSREKLRAKCVWIAVKCGVDSHLASGRISRVVAAIGAVTPLAQRARGKTLAISTRRG